MKSLHFIVLLFGLSGLAGSIPAQTGKTAPTPENPVFYGKFDKELAPDFVHVYQRIFKSIKDSSPLRFVPPLEKGTVISSGDLIDQRTAAALLKAMIVERDNAAPLLCMDLNSNGIVEAAERLPFPAQTGDAGDLDLLVLHPIDNPLFKTFPIFTRFKRGFKHPQMAEGDRLVLQTVMALAYGTVMINGQSVRFQYPFNPSVATISTTEGLFGIDADGDGTIRNEQFSLETSYAAGKEVVFRLSNIFISSWKTDLVKNEVIVRSRSKAEYLRHEIAVGEPMPDFSFVDFEGKMRSLSDYRGKYLLVDFWGVWCADCRVETPYHVEALKLFRSRGLDILGLNTDQDIEQVKVYLQKNKMTWTQARNDSIRKLVEDNYRIQEYPSTLLLGPDGKVLVLDQTQLRGDDLLKTLERLLPKK